MLGQWLKTGHMLWYVYGNLSKEQSTQILNHANSVFSLQPVSPYDLSDARLVDLSSNPGNFHRLDIRVPDPDNENSCLVSYFQHGRTN